ncbi:MAG: pantoate kinase [Haloferacaceae archaeon]
MERATTFVPGHVTGFFSAHPAPDPRAAGSRGAGLALARGVETTVAPDGEPGVWLDGERADLAAVTRVLDALDASDVRVDVRSDLPPGRGFGVSGAAALGTALSANAALAGRRSENELVGVAHAAEVTAGTGLGDVVAQARGGVPIRLEPGGPDHGRLDGVPASRDTRVEWVTFGERSTPDVLGGDTTRLTAAGEAALRALVAEPTLDRLFVESRRFAERAGLLTDRVAAAVDRVATAGDRATMAMLGDTAVALGTGLSDAGFDPEHARIHPPGATLVGERKERR